MFFDPIVADNQMPQWIADSDTRINGQDRVVPVHVRRIYARIGEFNFILAVVRQNSKRLNTSRDERWTEPLA
jgi:hypothetical protein